MLNDVIISTICTMATTIISVCLAQSKTRYRIDQLEKKVEKHNQLIDRTYKLEEKTEILETKLDLCTNNK